MIHLLAASVWVGGLLSFVLGVWSIRKLEPVLRTHFTAQLIPRFSVLALISVAVLALTGVYSAVLQIGTLDALWNTLYGRALITKLLIMLAMIGLGAIHLLIVTPRLKQDAAARSATSIWPQRFRRSVTGEVILGVALVLSVGVFTSLPPARSTASASDLSAAAVVDDLDIALDITPGRVGSIPLPSTSRRMDKPSTMPKWSRRVSLRPTAISRRARRS